MTLPRGMPPTGSVQAVDSRPDEIARRRQFTALHGCHRSPTFVSERCSLAASGACAVRRTVAQPCRQPLCLPTGAKRGSRRAASRGVASGPGDRSYSRPSSVREATSHGVRRRRTRRAASHAMTFACASAAQIQAALRGIERRRPGGRIRRLTEDTRSVEQRPGLFNGRSTQDILLAQILLRSHRGASTFA